MTKDQARVDDLATLRRILLQADALLLDFDGPVCSVFSGFPAPMVAAQLREVLAEGGHRNLPPQTEKTDDPFDVFSYAATLGEREARYIEATLRAHEVEAVATAEPTSGGHEVIRKWRNTGRKLAIVSNNSAAAVEAYLGQHKLAQYVNAVSARVEPDPTLLKPNPIFLHQACDALHVKLRDCVLIGDSLSDVQAAKTAGTQSLAYANKKNKIELFSAEHPDAVMTLMTIAADILDEA